MGIGNFTGLTDLDLSFNAISDLRPLGELTSLIELNLHANSISDISPLSRVPALYERGDSEPLRGFYGSGCRAPEGAPSQVI